MYRYSVVREGNPIVKDYPFKVKVWDAHGTCVAVGIHKNFTDAYKWIKEDRNRYK